MNPYACHICAVEFHDIGPMLDHERRCHRADEFRDIGASVSVAAERDRRLDERAMRDDLIKLERELADG